MTDQTAVVDRPDSVTHFVCPEGDGATHHLNGAGNCIYCKKSQAVIRKEVGL